MMRLAAAVAALAIVLGACGSDAEVSAPDEDVPTTETTEAPSTNSSPTSADATGSSPAESTSTSAADTENSDCATSGVHTVTVSNDGTDHTVRIFLPSSTDGSALPVVVNWHGLGSDGPQQALFSGYEAVAESEGFMVVHPTGVPNPGDVRNSWELADEQDPTRDDVAFAHELLDVLVDEWCADPDRVFSTGMSNGGFFTARLVCEMPERLAAAVSVAGISHPPECAPTEAVPFRAYHGTDDRVVPFDGSGESVLLDPSDPDPVALEFFRQVMPDEFGEFAADAGCEPIPERVDVSPEVVRYDYGGCDDSVAMSFFELVGSGHTWPGSPLGPFLEDAVGFTTDDVSATVDGWAFFETVTG